MKTTDGKAEELRKRVRDSAPLVERLKIASTMIGKMCSSGRPPRMPIPVRHDDEDFFISTTLHDAAILIEAYRDKRAVDGGGHLFKTDGTHTPTRTWDAGRHYDADIAIELLEAHEARVENCEAGKK